MRGFLPVRYFKDIFDRKLRAINKAYALTHSSETDLKTFYLELGISSLLNRLASIKGKQFRNVAFIGPCADWFVETAMKTIGLEALTVVDDAPTSLDQSLSRIRSLHLPGLKSVGVTLDEESWNFPADYFDLIVNNLQLHWLNNVHNSVSKWHKSLRSDGALIGVALGGDTLQELRIALSLAEQEREGGISSHVSPMLTVTDIGNLLNRTEYRLVTATADANTLLFDDLFGLMEFLQAIGESNANYARRSIVSKHTFIAAAAIYKHLFALRQGSHIGKVPATFDVVHYIGWKEHESQAKPLRPGAKGIDIRTLATEVQDEDMEQGEMIDKEGELEVNYVRKGDKSKQP